MHKKRYARFFIALLSVTLMTSGILSNSLIQAETKQAEITYEIYPKPHDITYEDGSFIIHKQVNIVAEEGIDEATRNKITNILTEKGIIGIFSNKIDENTTNILLGIHGSNGIVDQTVEDVDATLFERIEPYYLDIADNNITILGGDTDAVFYGIVTLGHILQQMDGKTIQNLVVEDYADTKTRGFIEGYYGIPWTNEDRMSLMRFGGDLKMTSYVFAPKDDPYHSARWRDPYPEDKLAGIAEMAAVGNANKCRFVWTIHPFMNGGITEASYDVDIVKIKAKFEQLYNAGVRQFGVLGDDAGGLPRSVVVRVMKDLQAWVDSKGDVYNLVFCPGGYNNSWWSAGELDEYDAGFDSDIQIFWTGNSVCAPIIQNTLDNFRKRDLPAGKDPRRAPLFWLNWPVNDINMSRLMMGKGSLLSPDVNIEDLSGVVTNPMQDAEPSKVALFAVADYAWNVKDFDDDQSWEDSFKYIDADASDALHTLATHMSDPAPNGHGLVLEESLDMQPLIDAFMNAYDSGSDLKAPADALVAEYKKIMKACDDFQTQSKNERLKEQILVFSNSLRDLSEATMEYMNTAIALENNDINAVWSHYSQAQSLMDRSKTYQHITLNGSQAALPASKRLRPFAEKLSTKLSGPVNSLIDESKVVVTPITNRKDSPNNMNNMVDGNPSTYTQWQSPNSATAGDYLGISFSRSVNLKDIEFLMSDSAASNKNTFKTVKMQYTEDGKEWKDLNDKTFGPKTLIVSADGLDVNVKGVRVIATENTPDIWLSCREITYNKADQPAKPVNPVLIKRSGMSYYSGNDNSLIDGDDSTFGWFNANGAVGDYVGVDLQSVADIDSIRFVMGSGGDFWKDYDLEYSVDGTNYTKIKNYTQSEAQKIVQENVSDQNIQARYLRIFNKAATNTWTKICEFSVRVKEKDSTVYTNSEALKDVTAIIKNDHSSIDAMDDVVLQSGEYIGLKLSRIRDIARIEADDVAGLTLQVSDNAIIWNDVTDKNDVDTARYIRFMNTSDQTVTFDLQKFDVYSYEIEPISVENTSFGSQGTHLNMFDNNRNTEVILQNSQNAGQYITYDLGQTIALNSLKAVAYDSTTDFPRHAKIAVSADGVNWTDIMYLGNQDSNNPGEAENTDNIMDILPDHEISFNTKSVRDLNIDTRYIKFEITRDKAGADKWVRFREFEINDGKYIPSSNDPTITTNGGVTTGNEPSNVIDGDVATIYKPMNNDSGELVYKLSDKTDFNKLSIFQSPTNISNARVSVYAIADKKNVEASWVDVGTLSGSTNEFNLDSFTNVLAVKIAWDKDALPSIHEIITAKVAGNIDINKDNLQTAINKATALDVTTWTDASKAALRNALENAKTIYNSAYATQAIVDSYTFTLDSAMNNYKVKGDMEAYRTQIEAIMQGVKEQESYLARTWRLYQEKLDAANGALENSELTDEELKGYVDALSEAAQQLVFEVTSMEDLTLLYETTSTVINENYTIDSITDLQSSLAKAQALIAAEKEARQDPEVVKGAMSELQIANDNLVSVVALKAAIAQGEAIEPAGFTQASYQVLRDALTAANTELTSGTNESVAAAIVNIQTSIKNLVVEGEDALAVYKQILSGAIGKANDLIEHGALVNLNEQVKKNFEAALLHAVNVYAKADVTKEELMSAWSDLASAMHYLDFKADKTALDSLYKECVALDKTLYVNDENMAEFEAAMIEANDVLASDTALNERIEKAYDRLSTAKEHLVLKADVIDTKVIDFMIQAGNKAVAEKAYYDTTVDSWKVFENALETAVKARAEMVSQVAIDEATHALSAAYVDIRLIANEEKLQELTDFTAMIDALKQDQYTTEAYAYFMETRAAVQEMINAQSYTAAQYAAFLNAKEEVARRIREDVIAPSVPEEPTKPEEPTNPEGPSVPGDSSNSNVPQAPSGDMNGATRPSSPDDAQPSAPSTSQTIAKTGDGTQLGMWACTLLGAGIAVTLLRRRKD